MLDLYSVMGKQGTVNSLSKAIIAQLLDCGNINYKNYTLVTKH